MAFQYRYNRAYSVLLFLLFIGLGWLCAFIGKAQTLPESLLDKDRFVLFEVKEITHRNVTTEIKAVADIEGIKNVNLIAVLQGNDYKIRIGDNVYCRSKIERIKSSFVPESFDYANYMKNNGYLYRLFIERGKYFVVNHTSSLHAEASKMKNSLLQTIRIAGLEHGTTNFIITILTGNNKFIDSETRDSFSKSGLAHILAVSGLHIAVISMIIAFLLKPLDRFRLRWLRLLISLAFIWAFAYFTGLHPSAVRASIMATFMIMAIILFRKHSVLNALCGSAVLILVIDPYSLFDLGFQLSYLSVLGIVLFAEKLTIGERFSLKKKLTSVMAVSISAQIGIMVITSYYFNTIPIAFLISNILVVPLLPIFMPLSIIMIMATIIGFHIPLLSEILDFIYKIINTVAETTGNMPFSSIDDIWIFPAAAICLYFAILFIGIWINREKRSKALLYMSIISAFLAVVVTISCSFARTNAGLFITDGYNTTNVVFYSGKRACIVNSTNDTTEINSFIEHNRRFFLKQGISEIKKVTDSANMDGFIADYPYIFINGIRIGFVSGNLKRMYLGNKKITLDYLIVTKRYYNDIKTLDKYYEYGKLVIPCEIHTDKRSKLLNEAKELRKNIIDMELSPVNIGFR